MSENNYQTGNDKAGDSFFNEDAPNKKQGLFSLEDTPKRVIFWRIFKPVLTVLISIAVVAAALVIVFNKLYADYFSPVDINDTEKVEIVIPSGSSLSKISKLLEENGIIRNARVFKYYVDFSDMSSKIKAGKFMLSKSMTFDDIIDVIKRPNKMSAEIWVQILEGETVEQIADTLVESGMDIEKSDFLELCNKPEVFAESSKTAKRLAERSKDGKNERKYILEGYLFPEKYRFYSDASEEDVILKLLKQFETVADEETERRASENGFTVDQIVILASLIEKEAKTDDFKGVSAVFRNRINEAWTLGSDASIKYITNGTDITLSTAELELDSPYNTYKYSGLPPGPICNPGKAAIEAAINPDKEIMKGKYMFFCLGDPNTGETVFTKTQEEHDRAVAKYSSMWEEYDRQKKNGEADG